MRQCSRCSELNHDDASHCALCGLEMPTAGGLGELADDSTDVNDATPVGLGLGGATSAASVPTEAMPTMAGPAASAGAMTQIVPEATPVPVVRSAGSASLVFAMLVVAAVVIVGGVFVLLGSGSGGDTARTGELPSAPVPAADTIEPSTSASGVEPVETAAPATTSAESVPPVTVPPDTVPPDTAPVDTAPADTAPVGTTPSATAPVGTAPGATAPADTAPSTTGAPTTAAPATTTATTTSSVAGRAAGDLGLSQPILDEPCDGRYITFIGAAVGEQSYGPVVQSLLDEYPDANYIWTKSCPSLRQELANGSDIYGVVFGPYDTREEACGARAEGPENAYVRRISTTDPEDHTVDC